MRWRRRAPILRSALKARELAPIRDRTDAIGPRDVLLFAVQRNELPRLPFFLDYYRRLGVGHFLIADNDSDDGSADYLAGQPDVSVWRARGSYKASRYGMDWLMALLRRHGQGHWCLTVDTDELFVYPFCDTRPLAALTDWLDGAGSRAFGAMLIDMYPEGPVEAARCAPGQDPREVAPWFDPGNYVIERNPALHNLWIQGGPRMRAFFADAPERAPALNKIPLVRWDRRFAYVSSTHMLLPRGLNRTYCDAGGERASGALLHMKFAGGFAQKTREEIARREHYATGVEYAAYARALDRRQTLWTRFSERYRGWRQLEELGLISAGGWA